MATRSASSARKQTPTGKGKPAGKSTPLKLIPKQRAAVEVMALDEVERFVETLPIEYIQCRELGHPWQPHRARRTDTGFERTLLCPRCTAEKHQTLDARAHPVGSPRIEYPEDYLNTGNGRIDGNGRDVVRYASITRILD